MTERASGVGQSRSKEWSDPADATSSTTTTTTTTKADDPGAKRVREDREAAARTNAWISSGDHDAGSSRSASSMPVRSPTSTQATRADYLKRDSDRTRLIDKPLEHDVIGNAIPMIVGAGLMGGLEAAAGGAGAVGVAGAAAKHSGEHAAVDLAEHGAHVYVDSHHYINGAEGQPSRGPSPSTPAQMTATTTSAGQSGPNATSQPAATPNKSEPAPPLKNDVRGQDRAPYAPGQAPFRIPEAPLPIRG